MTIQLVDGFGSGQTPASMTGWTSLFTIQNGTGRFAAGYAEIAGTAGTAIRPLATARTKVGCHIAWWYDTANTGSRAMMFSESGGNTHVYVALTAAGKLALYHGSGTLLGDSGVAVPPQTWVGIEVWVEISDSVGVAKMWVNGATSPQVNFSGDTRNAGTGNVQEIRVFDTAGSGKEDRIDDFVVYDDQGSSNNTAPLGDLRVVTLRPNGNGNSSVLTGSDGNTTDNYLLVDDPSSGTHDSDTTYVESSTVGDKDTYAMSDTGISSGSVLAVRGVLVAKKTDAGTRTIVPVYRLSGTEVDGSTLTLTSSYALGAQAQDVQETKPGGGAWSLSDVDSAEFGVKVTA